MEQHSDATSTMSPKLLGEKETSEESAKPMKGIEAIYPRLYRKTLPGRTKPLKVDRKHVRNCHTCQNKLGIRIQHCENCGKIFCKKCCNEEVPLAHKELKNGKVCNNCLDAEMAYADGLIIFLRLERMFKTKCVDCGGAFSFFKKKKYGCLTCVQENRK